MDAIMDQLLTWDICKHDKPDQPASIETNIELIWKREVDNSSLVKHTDELVQDEQFTAYTKRIKTDKERIPNPGDDV